MLTLLEVVKRSTDYFERRGLENARLNAELIIAHALGLKRMQIYLQFEQPIEEAKLVVVRELVRRRGLREPLAYVLGEAAFRDLTLCVDRRVLVPRPETEQLVELVKDTIALPPTSVLDLGTGSGALALALAQTYPDARIVAVDSSADALAVARENAVRCELAGQVKFRRSDWFETFTAGEQFDLVIANPPYLTEEEWSHAEPEVRMHEPRSALVAEDDGCAALRRILGVAPRFLTPGGWLFLETGIHQHSRLLKDAIEAGYADAKSWQDWSGRDRFVSARRPAIPAPASARRSAE